MSYRDIVLLFKATSWIFGPIEIPKERDTQLRSNLIFEVKNLKKSYVGLISKYIVDLSRAQFLISKGFKVYYVKYCDNEITTENNVLFAIKD